MSAGKTVTESDSSGCKSTRALGVVYCQVVTNGTVGFFDSGAN